jgi:hypothetical protein
MTFYPNGEAHTLSDSHHRMLEQGSAIRADVIAESGARTIHRPRDLPEVFGRRQRSRAPGVLFVVHRPNGSESWCFRPDKPDPDSPGHKYEQPCKALGGAGNVLDMLPSQRHLIADTSVPVVFVEGTKKMLSLVSAAREAGVALLVVAVTACWNWMADGKPIPDLLDIPLEGRRATVMYDSDMLRKPEVQSGAKGLAEYLKGRGAEVYITYFEDAQDGSKVGADDFFVAGGTLSELRMLTRRYKPEDFVRVRLSRDERLRAMLEDLEHRFWREEWKGMGGHTDRDVALKLIEAAFRHGKPVEGGVHVRKSWGSLQTEAKVAPRTLSKSLNRLEKRGFILERVKGKKPDKSGGFVLRASVYQGREEQGTEQKATQPLHGLYARTIHLRAPRLRWSSPGYKPRRGTSEGTRKVRQGPPPKPRSAIKRLGKIRGAIVDALDAAGGELTLQELCEVLKHKRPRDIRRRNLPMLQEAGILTVSEAGDAVTLADDWTERMDDVRRLGGEVEADELALTRLDIKRKAYHSRHETPKSQPSAEGFANVRASREKRAAHTEVPRARTDEQERRIAQLVREGMKRRFAEEEVSSRRPPPSEPGPKPEPKRGRSLPPKVGGVYAHGPLCDCWMCGEEESVA